MKNTPFVIISKCIQINKNQTFPIIYLGDFCKTSFAEKIDVFKSPLEDNQKLDESIQYIIEIFQHIILDLSKQLNRIHHTNYSINYWTALLASWLIHYISSIYNYYVLISELNNKYNKSWTTQLLDPVCFYTPSSEADLFDHSMNSDSYNFQLCSQVIQFLDKTKATEKIKVTIETNQNKQTITKIIKQLIKISLLRITKHLNKKATFISSYLEKKELIKLLFKSFGKGIFIFPNLNHKKGTQINHTMREKLNRFESNTSDSFIQCLYDLLAINMPKSFLEDFNYYEKKCYDYFPKQPKSIITADGVWHNEYIRFWIAQCKNKGIPIYGLQHGGTYGTAQHTLNEFLELYVYDKYFTWGWDKSYYKKFSNKIIPFYKIKRMKTKENQPSKKILLVTTNISKYMFRLMNTNYFDMPNYFKMQCQFIDAISDPLKNQLTVRLYRNDFGWGVRAYYEENYPDLTLEDMKNITFEHSLSKTSLAIIDHCSTTFLETLSENIPTLLFWNPTIEKIRDDAQPFFNLLRDTNILHDSPQTAAQTLTQIHNNINDWWHEKNRQVAIKKFCEQFARKSNNITDEYLNAFF